MHCLFAFLSLYLESIQPDLIYTKIHYLFDAKNITVLCVHGKIAKLLLSPFYVR